ncbi:DNA cytosine methyltransferase [Rhizobium sp. LjRoot258]|uniref:DNA cytosine methyltransferase n=1 Tax=Rhizobium sp. LjRoot258 TaxID=3342299 RepID=UPI003ED07DFE
MADIDIKAQALSDARTRILKLQEQMTDRLLQMAAEVETLMEIVPPMEARTFLKARCNLPAVELSTYVGFAKTLKGAEEVLRKARVSFPVLKALVAADPEAKQEVLERMQIGAQIDTKDVAAIRRRLSDAKLTVAEAIAIRNRRLAAAAARKQMKATIALFEEKMWSFVRSVRMLPPETPVVPDDIRKRAGSLLEEFESVFGAEHPQPRPLKRNSPGQRIGRAHHALTRFRNGDFGNTFGFGLNDSDIGPTAVDALLVLTGKPQPVYGLVKAPSPLTELPPPRYHLKALEICAGAGGMAVGLERAGFHHVGLVELDKNAAATLRKNRPHWPVIEADVRTIDFTQFRRSAVDLLVGGIPCQPYSTSGKSEGKNDEKDLLLEGVRAVKESKPKAFVFENVEGFLHAKHADHVASALRRLSKAGYEVSIHRINTRDYGIAQDRSRILVIGLRKELAGAFRMPPRFPGWRTNIGDALADLMGANGWSDVDKWVRAMREQPFHDKFRNFVQRGALSATIRGRKGAGLPKETERWLRKGFTYAPIPKEAPTDTDAQKRGFVPGLTLRMRARLQDFPDDWQFVGGVASVAEQIGNAVAPRMAQAVGLAMFSALRAMELDWDALLFGRPRRPLVVAPPLDLHPEISHTSSILHEDAL